MHDNDLRKGINQIEIKQVLGNELMCKELHADYLVSIITLGLMLSPTDFTRFSTRTKN
jgi:hypothetical protein